MSINERFSNKEPKYILSLDGGGVRGVLTLAFLERAEKLLAEYYNTGSKFRLSDHYTLIGGTSTGAIISTGLALGYTVAEMIDIYQTLSRKAFSNPRRLLGGVLVVPKFPSKQLEECIETHVQELSLGTSNLHCGLAIVAKRLDTDSVWVFHNHPNGPQTGIQDRGFGHTAKKQLLLKNLIRASTAAPSYFEPSFLHVEPGIEGTFIDGGLSLHNNPALALFMLTTLERYGFQWEATQDKLHILSVGTGKESAEVRGPMTRDTPTYRQVYNSIRSLMSDCDAIIHTKMRTMGHCLSPHYVESELGDLAHHTHTSHNAFSYARLNVEFNTLWLKHYLGLEIDEAELKHISRIDEPSAIERLLDIGRQAAKIQVSIKQLLL